jgi:flavin reductase (DIM6/NTAB) family NADH-FMN oxidoreductase RutF
MRVSNDRNLSLNVEFKRAMRRLASTVTIITTTTPAGRSGMTATAVTSVSADPPSVLICVNRSASIHSSLNAEASFCVNVLSEDHHDLSFAFGGKVAPDQRFALGTWSKSEDNGVPYLADAQANLFCTIDAVFPYGTHSIVIGKVTHVQIHGEVRPLIYGDGRFIPMAAPV